MTALISCQYTPPTTKKKPKLPKILASGPDVLKRELAEKACRRKFTLSLLPKVEDWIKVEVIDGRGKSNIIEIFDTLGKTRTCTCDEYFEQEGSWCVHLSVLDGIENLDWSTDLFVKQWVLELSRARIKIPIHHKSFATGAIFWDSFEESQKLLGKSPQPTENWNAWKKFHKAKSTILATNTGPLPSSAGLLMNNINLYQYQEDIFQKMLINKRAICSMVMGSGKTLTTIACYAHLLKSNPKLNMLVIAPKSLCLQWVNEIKRATNKNSTFVRKPEQIKDIPKFHGPAVATYQYVTRNIDEFKKHNYDVIVVDEIQFLKNGDTKVWKAINQLSSEYFYGLSGTVIENRMDDFYSIMEIIAPGVLGPQWKFNHTYQNVLAQTGTKVIYTGVKNLDLLKTKVSNRVFFYDNIVLPPISHNYIYVTCNPSEKASHDEWLEQAKILISKSMNTPLSQAEKIMVQAFLLKARQAANAKELLSKNKEPIANKVREALKIIRGVVGNGGKIVVFSQWIEYLNLVKRETDVFAKSVSYTGAQDVKARDKAVKDFQNDSKIQIFFATDAGGVGLDGLQLVSNTVLHLELPWNPSKLDQRTGRVYRLQQTKPVNAYYLVSLNTIEISIENLLKSKRDIRTQTLQNFL